MLSNIRCFVEGSRIDGLVNYCFFIFIRAPLRSSAHGQLLVPKFKTKLYGNRSFAVGGRVEWNKFVNITKCNMIK